MTNNDYASPIPTPIMVRNHQDEYPDLIFLLKISWNLNFVVKLIGQGIQDGKGRGIARDL